MGSTNHPRHGIGKKHGLAIGRQDRQTKARGGGDHAISFDGGFEGSGQMHHIGGMHLMQANQGRGGQAQSLCHPRPIDLHHFRQVAAARPAVQPRKYPRRCAALAGEEPVAKGQGI